MLMFGTVDMLVLLQPFSIETTTTTTTTTAAAAAAAAATTTAEATEVLASGTKAGYAFNSKSASRAVK